MKRAFLDTNFLLDLLARDGELQVNALKVLEIGRKSNVRFYVSFLSLANYAYIMRKENKDKLFENLTACCRLFTIVPNDRDQIMKAIELNPNDFEDALQYESALKEKCDCILTRDSKGFEISSIRILSPVAYIMEFGESLK